MNPVEWTEELIDYLCESIAGGAAIHTLAGTNGLPSEPTIYREMAKNEEFRAKITAARIAQQEYEADNCIKMADDATEENWQVVKLRIWARQWRASKLAPKRYGDRIEIAGDPNNPLITQRNYSPDDIATLKAYFEATKLPKPVEPVTIEHKASESDDE